MAVAAGNFSTSPPLMAQSAGNLLVANILARAAGYLSRHDPCRRSCLCFSSKLLMPRRAAALGLARLAQSVHHCCTIPFAGVFLRDAFCHCSPCPSLDSQATCYVPTARPRQLRAQAAMAPIPAPVVAPSRAHDLTSRRSRRPLGSPPLAVYSRHADAEIDVDVHVDTWTRG